MANKLAFSDWMKLTTKLSDSSIYKYTRAVYAISKDMLSVGAIIKDLELMNLAELDLIVPIILNNPEFVDKNSRGNNMYSNALKQYRGYIAMIDEREVSYQNIVDTINQDISISVTERDALIRSRVGQGLFRDTLMHKYNSTCVITGINLKRTLIASHIKPWAISNNHERLSGENGLLLSATFDRLFDSGLISFESNGKILISHYIDDFNKAKLHISSNTIAYIKPSAELSHNLEYHRDVLFIQ